MLTEECSPNVKPKKQVIYLIYWTMLDGICKCKSWHCSKQFININSLILKELYETDVINLI